MSLEPIENPSKYSRNSSASTALDGSSHIMMTRSPFSPRRRPFSREQVDDGGGFAEGADERDHDLDVGEPHLVAHELQRFALHVEARAEVLRDVAGCAAVSDHRILLVRLVRLAADEIRVLVGLEVRQPHDHRLRRERRARASTRPRRRAARSSRAARGTPRCARRSRRAAPRAACRSRAARAGGCRSAG